MFIELIDLLRCTQEHEDSWLVAAFTRLDQRFVLEGRLGCHVCGASFPIHDGVADMRATPGADTVRLAGTHPGQPLKEDDVPAPSTDDAVRFAALLGLTRPASLIVMEGEAASLATAISEMTESRVIALDPPHGLTETDRVGLVLSGARIPLGSRSVDGILVGKGSRLIGDAARVLKSGGRLVAPAGTRLTGMFREVARDDRHVVAESVGELIALKR